MKTSTATSFVASYLDAWNQGDASAVMACMCPNGCYVDEAWQVEMTGASLLEELSEFFESYHYQYEVSGDILCGDNTISFQYLAKNNDSKGEEGSFRGADFITLEGGLALEIRDFYVLPEDREVWIRRESRVQYVKSGLSQSELATLLANIEHAMSHEKLYLDANLSLPKLSAHLDTSVNYVSQAINSGLNSNFFHMVNRYRVEAAAALLESDVRPLKSTGEIALAVGFKSVSTFYTAFHKVTGQAPGAYRRRFKKAP